MYIIILFTRNFMINKFYYYYTFQEFYIKQKQKSMNFKSEYNNVP